MLIVFDNVSEKIAFDEVVNKSVYYGDFDLEIEEPFKSALYVKLDHSVPMNSASLVVANHLIEVQKREGYK